MSRPTSAETWPQPPTSDRPWHTRRLALRHDGQVAEVVVREVRLWGRVVLIDDDRAVYCPDCRRFLPVEELGRPGNGHRVGVRGSSGVWRLSMSEDGEPVRRERGPVELEW